MCEEIHARRNLFDGAFTDETRAISIHTSLSQTGSSQLDSLCVHTGRHSKVPPWFGPSISRGCSSANLGEVECRGTSSVMLRYSKFSKWSLNKHHTKWSLTHQEGCLHTTTKPGAPGSFTHPPSRRFRFTHHRVMLSPSFAAVLAAVLRGIFIAPPTRLSYSTINARLHPHLCTQPSPACCVAGMSTPTGMTATQGIKVRARP